MNVLSHLPQTRVDGQLGKAEVASIASKRGHFSFMLTINTLATLLPCDFFWLFYYPACPLFFSLIFIHAALHLCEWLFQQVVDSR